MIPWWLNPWAEARKQRELANQFAFDSFMYADMYNCTERALRAAESALDYWSEKRSAATAKGNKTRAANRRAKQDQTTEKLRENHAQ